MYTLPVTMSDLMAFQSDPVQFMLDMIARTGNPRAELLKLPINKDKALYAIVGATQWREAIGNVTEFDRSAVAIHLEDKMGGIMLTTSVADPLRRDYNRQARQQLTSMHNKPLFNEYLVRLFNQLRGGFVTDVNSVIHAVFAEYFSEVYFGKFYRSEEILRIMHNVEVLLGKSSASTTFADSSEAIFTRAFSWFQARGFNGAVEQLKADIIRLAKAARQDPQKFPLIAIFLQDNDDNAVMAHIVGLLTGAMDTTANVIAALLFSFGNEPALYDIAKATRGVDAIAGAVITAHNTAPITTRNTVQDFRLANGDIIPSNSLALLNVFTANRQLLAGDGVPDYSIRISMVKIAQRLLESDKVARTAFNNAFGGPSAKHCPGEGLAEAQVIDTTSFISNHGLAIQLRDAEKAHYIAPLTMRPTGFQVMVAAR